LSTTLTKDDQREVEALVPFAKMLARKLCGHQDPEDAEGLALVHLCMAVAAYIPGKRTLKSFVRASITYALDNWRDRKIMEERNGLAGGTLIETGRMDPTPETRALWSDLFNLLPEKLRQTAYAKWIERMTELEIAVQLGISREAVHKRIAKAEAIAKKYLECEGG